MVVLSKIYTKTGDDGQTSLGNGERTEKHSLRVQSYGTVDECNACVGLACLHAQDQVHAQLTMIQNDLFDLGADLCRPNMDKDDQAQYKPLRMSDTQVARLESQIDAMTAQLAPLKSFILPGGSPLSAHLHLCRTVARRAERLTVHLSLSDAINPQAVKYLNRVSDWFFCAARMANAGGENDILWVPGANR